ncbi:DEAD/DEAH box helicase [Thiospirochaeta perfilievii]|uniref:RNA helicase n=1 Tax=Thiospirochaeta perfilievii TaxID=252967 RepID=A0A5C1QG23_9SPIO|nr:DEAD/DEAH box helicase [Thiospirochaeta perfilievii]QEN05486.1 DEAD/DEAH box helicase [Thiospirochaeta perfilievii]
MEEKKTFRDLGLSEEILQAIEKKGFEEPSPIQALTIPILLKGDKNIIGQAQTGTGKTAAFGLPILDTLTSSNNKNVQALILAPTRELAVQVSDELISLKGEKRLSVAAIYGGQAMGEQLRRLRRGVDIVVGTPGRVQDHINRGSLDLSNLSYLILDEADEMLNMGFVDDIEKILETVNEDKKMLLFSATMPSKIQQIAKKYMGDYELFKVKNRDLTSDLTEQIYFEVNRSDKFEALCRIVDIEEEFFGIVFCRTKVDVDDVSQKLSERGYSSGALHGDISQAMRERILSQLKSKQINILVATDVAARGIDVNHLSHVINYSLPQDAESYVHRVGRTGRAGNEGTAITFVTKDEYRKLLYIQRVSGKNIKKDEIPGVDKIISTKKDRIMKEILKSLETGDDVSSTFKEMALELLQESENPVDVIASVLSQAFGDDLDESNYNEIRKINMKRSGTTRLFVAKGRQDDFTAKSLVELITSETSIPGKRLDSVQIFDQFSFVTVPFEDAEEIILAFKNAGRGNRPLVEQAKESKGGSGGGGRRGGGDRNRGGNRGGYKGGGNREGGNRGSRNYGSNRGGNRSGGNRNSGRGRD